MLQGLYSSAKTDSAWCFAYSFLNNLLIAMKIADSITMICIYMYTKFQKDKYYIGEAIAVALAHCFGVHDMNMGLPMADQIVRD